MAVTNKLTRRLTPGKVYRREDLEQYSPAVDRDLNHLVQQGSLRKAARGVYYVPRKTAFGQAPPEDKELVRGFLRDDRFLITSPNAYNSLGVGTTQLYNEPVVYNHKRHGRFKLGSRVFDFRVKPHFPRQLTEAFLLVDLLNNLNDLAEDREEVLARVAGKTKTMDATRLRAAVRRYGSVRTRKLFSSLVAD